MVGLSRTRRDLALLLVVAIAIRLVFVPLVGVWGDMGFYAINSRLILEGQRPFIDFLGRSPTAIYLFAAVRSVADNVPLAFRLTINALWVLTALPVYGLAREALDHRAGLLAAAVMLVSPFSLVYGHWTNTQPHALLPAMTALYVLVRYDTLRWHAVAGALFGVAFLARRSVVAIAGGVALYMLYRNYQDPDRSVVSVGQYYVSMAAAGIATLGIAYLLLAYFHIPTAIALADIHFVNLFITTGRGGYGMITNQPVASPTRRLQTGRVPVFNDICQLCGVWTARTWAKTILAAIPPLLVGWSYMRHLTDNHMTDSGVQYLYGIVIMLGLFALVQTVLIGRWVRAVAIVMIAASGILVYRVDPVSDRILYGRETGMILACGLALSTAYLYRNRVLHTYYFMDFWPLLSVAAGVVGIELWRRAERPARVALVGIVIVSSVTAMAGAYPLANMITGNDGGWHTIETAQQSGREFDERGDDVVVLTANPTYMASAEEARVWQDNARVHYVANTFGPERPPGTQMFDNLSTALQSGKIDYIVYQSFSKNILANDRSTTRAFRENYCRVNTDSKVYETTHATLYEYCGDDT